MSFFKAILLATMIAACVFSCTPKAFADDDCDFYEDFESGIGNWWADNGVWQVGTPTTVGPVSCHSGEQCAATILDGNYYSGTDSDFNSPSIRLPEISGDQEIWLRFWQWHSYSSSDYGQVFLYDYDEDAEDWNTANAVGEKVVVYSHIWTQKNIDITKYAGKKIRLAFYHADDSGDGDLPGWYIDDIQIICGQGVWVMTTDNDDDGVPDCRDQCPSTPPDSYVNNVGCKASSCYSQDQVNSLVNGILTWGDTDGDGQIGLNEAIEALQTTAGVSGQ